MRGKSFNWSRLRKVVQILFLLLWMTLWTTTASLTWGKASGRLPAEMDPLLALTQAIASRTLSMGMPLSLGIIVLTLVFGRAWCGWICPIGTLLDFFNFKKRNGKWKLIPETWRRGKFLLLLAILIAALFGNLTLIILDPVTIWVRTMTGGVGPVLNTAFTAIEYTLSDIPWMSSPLTWVDQMLRPAVFPQEMVGIRFVWLPVLILIALIAANFLAERFWCRYLCPLGGLLGLLSRVSIFKRSVKGKCVACNRCSAVCPTDTINPEKGYSSDPAECTMCMDCVDSCGAGQTTFIPNFSIQKKMPYDPERRQLLLTSSVALIGLAAIKTQSSIEKGQNFLLRPPGAENQDLLNKCMRCGLCLRTCPTGALQASITESGLEGLFTPVLVPRLGYCLYSCNKCGTICPVEAIPSLTLEEKQQWVIGKAFIDQNRCIPWADQTTCIVCEEMCPLPDKAISLEEKVITQADGSAFSLKLPHVDRTKCIGCGICEYKCPQAGQAAIRVYQDM